MEGVVVVGEGAGIPSEHCQNTLEQGTNACIGLCGELETHPVGRLCLYPSCAPERDKAVKKTGEFTNFFTSSECS